MSAMVVNLIPLGELATIVMGQAPSSNDCNFEGRGTPFVKVGEFAASRPVIREWTTNPLKMARSTDVLVCVVGATCGKLNLGEDCAIGRSVAAIRPEPLKLDQFYLHYFLMTLIDRLRAGSVGAAQTVISKEMIQSIPFPWRDLSEQRRIVAILDEAFEGIATAKANAEKNLQNARELFGRISGAVLAQLTPISRIARLENLVAPDCSLSYGIVQPGDEFTDGLPIVRPVDLNCSVVGLNGLKRIDPALAKSYDRTTLKGNDILLCVRGTTGTLALADSTLVGANVTRGIVPIRFDSRQLSQEFGYCLMRAEPAQSQIRAKTYGTALMQINIRDLRQLSLPIPPLQEQEAIVQRVGDVEVAADRLTARYERKLAALNDLKKSLLHQAFTGAL